MPEDNRERLKGIKSFPSLVKYLRDELGWPIGSDPFDKEENKTCSSRRLSKQTLKTKNFSLT